MRRVDFARLVSLASTASFALAVFETVGAVILAIEANGNSRPGLFIELNAFFDPLLFQFSTKNIGTVPALAVSMLELSDIATLRACISP